jgi:hypothetical protein
VQTLLRADLVDELRLVVAPVVLGEGKRLFGDGAVPRSWRLTASSATPTGVLLCTYRRGGEVRPARWAPSTRTPSAAEHRGGRASAGRRGAGGERLGRAGRPKCQPWP